MEHSADREQLSPLPKVPGLYLIEEIAIGGASIVYRAFDEILNRPVALKMLYGELDTAAVTRFKQEARMLASLHHPNIVQIYQYGIAEDRRPYLVMELVNGTSLAHRLESGPLTLQEFSTVFPQVLKALEAAHFHNLIHGDVNPANIVLCQSQTVISAKLVDFGIGQAIEAEGKVADRRKLCGTPLYMSPEQIAGQTCDARADLYSLACVMYETLIGVPPFDGENSMEIMYKHGNSSRPVSSSLTKVGVPVKLAAVITRALSINPSDRFQSAAELAAAIKRGISADEFHEPEIKQRSERFIVVVPIIALVAVVLCMVVFHIKFDRDLADQRAELTALPKNAVFHHQSLEEIHDAAYLAICKNDYNRCLTNCARVLETRSPVRKLRIDALIWQEHCYEGLGAQAKRESDKINYRKVALESAVKTISEILSFTTLECDDQLIPIVRAYLEMINTNGFDSVKTAYQQLLTLAGHSIHEIGLRRAWASTLVDLDRFQEGRVELAYLLDYDCEFLGPHNVTTVRDLMYLHNLELRARNMVEQGKLLRQLRAILEGEECPLVNSDRTTVAADLGQALIGAHHTKEAESLLAMQLSAHVQDHRGDNPRQLAELQYALSLVYRAQRNIAEEAKHLEFAYKLSDTPRDLWKKRLSELPSGLKDADVRTGAVTEVRHDK